MIRIERVDENGNPTTSLSAFRDGGYRRGLFYDWPPSEDSSRLPCIITEIRPVGSEEPLLALASGAGQAGQIRLTQETALRLAELFLYFGHTGELPDEEPT